MENLAPYTTLGLGGPAREFVEAGTAEHLVSLIAEADRLGRPTLVLGGGSNLVVADDGFPGTVVRIATTGVEVGGDACGGADVVVEAGEDWDAFVERAVESEWIGVEALSGIPGTTGATPIQNVGAYGQEVSETIASVHTYDRLERRTRTFANADCEFGYRTSRFKREPDRFVVGAVTFQFRLGSMAAPVQYAELARTLGASVGDRVPASQVRGAVLELRRSKGMVLDPVDHDTWSAGSFFTNPFVEPADVPEGAPAFPQPDGSVKTSAAWLIEQAGFSRGYGNHRVSLSTKHTLALTNRGTATTADLLALAAELRDGVRETFGITLHPEPVLLNCTL